MKWAYEQIEEKNQFNIIEVTPLFIPFVFHNSRKTKRNNTRTREEKNEYQKNPTKFMCSMVVVIATAAAVVVAALFFFSG